jgi:hypothetical protein
MAFRPEQVRVICDDVDIIRHWYAGATQIDDARCIQGNDGWRALSFVSNPISAEAKIFWIFQDLVY